MPVNFILTLGIYICRKRAFGELSRDVARDCSFSKWLPVDTMRERASCCLWQLSVQVTRTYSTGKKIGGGLFGIIMDALDLLCTPDREVPLATNPVRGEICVFVYLRTHILAGQTSISTRRSADNMQMKQYLHVCRTNISLNMKAKFEQNSAMEMKKLMFEIQDAFPILASGLGPSLVRLPDNVPSGTHKHLIKMHGRQ
ncbi:hypothetical protein CBL_05545 [Carabus blaptoides fortunei]